MLPILRNFITSDTANLTVEFTQGRLTFCELKIKYTTGKQIFCYTVGNLTPKT